MLAYIYECCVHSQLYVPALDIDPSFDKTISFRSGSCRVEAAGIHIRRDNWAINMLINI